jgi:Gpi18-like mannosyltransferase
MSSQTSRPPIEQVSIRTIALIAAFGILLRVIIAYVALPPDAGFAADLNSFRAWASELGSRGPWGFYARGIFVDYLPGYMWVLWALGSLGALVTGSTDPGALVKLPAILADGLLVFATVRLAADLGASRRGQLAAAAAIAAGPMIWLDSAVWGQVDSVGTVTLLFALSALIRGKTIRGAIFAALAAVLKPQFGILIPIVGVLAFVRARSARDPWAFVVAGLAGVATVALAALPFGLALPDVFTKIAEAAGGYPYLSVNAWNPWALITVGGRSVLDASGWASDIDALPLIGVPGVAIGSAALAAAVLAAMRFVRRDTAIRTVIAVTVLAITFFVLPTRVHERYLFPAIPLTIALAAARPAWRWIAALTSAAFLANSWGVLTISYFQNPGLPNLGALTDALHTPAAVVTVAVATTTTLMAATWLAWNTDKRDTKARVSTPQRKRVDNLPRRVVTAKPEPRRSLTRIDLWLLILVTVSAMSLRGWRVGEPTHFQFDEVYHVRTATEFMQDWRYGEPHAIYEYTHPHLAKYLIALGLETFGAPRVDARTTYPTTIGAIAARSEDALSPGIIWIAGPEKISVIDAETRAVIGSLPVPKVSTLFAARDGSLWGATANGTMFSADRATADQGGLLGLRTWPVAGGIVYGIAPLTDGSVAAVQRDQVVIMRDGLVTASAPLTRGSAVLALTVSGKERIFVTSESGLTTYSADDLSMTQQSAVVGGAVAVAAVDWFDAPRLYVAGRDGVRVYSAKDEAATLLSQVTIPGATAILPSDGSRMVHVVAPGPDGASASLWTIEPNGNARFADVGVGVDARSLGTSGAALDASAERADGGNGELLLAAPSGAMAQVNVGDLAAGWRWPGVIAGALAAALLVLLARLLTERRDVAALVGLLALLDGAGFVQSRIGMNDVYLLALLLGGTVAFVAWLQGRVRGALPGGLTLILAGVLLGGALASKWVALYGIFGLGIIWLARTAPGRLLVAGGLALLGATLLAPALAVVDGSTRIPNLPFAVTVALLLAATGAAIYRAGGITRRDATPRTLLSLLSLPGEATLVFFTLAALPLGVYVATYLPWAALGNQIVAGWPINNTGQTLVDLTASMYRYHDTLRVAHAASSPWWAWPLDLKPVWFFQSSFTAGGSSWTAAVYDGGNVLSRILSIGGALWLTAEAWRRRSWGLTSVLVLGLALWLPWARIDRAAFQYHYYPTSQIALIGLALLLADLRAGSQRAAHMLRIGGACAVLAAPVLWMTTGALCALAGVTSVYPESQVCLSGGFGTPGPLVGAIALVPATVAAWSILGAREVRRIFTITIGSIAAVALIWYPNWSALPLPTGIHNWYQGVLPTWSWPFQFGVTLEKPAETALISGTTVLLGLLLLFAAVAGAYGARRFSRAASREFNENRSQR